MRPVVTVGARLKWARRLSLSSVALGLWIAVSLMGEASTGALQVYRLGEWPAPFGIVLVVDRLSALMLVLTQLVALPVLWYASGGWDAHGRYFHAIFHFQGDGAVWRLRHWRHIFNLFVFFEILLIASYVLMVHDQGKGAFQAGVHYVVLNLLASALFLIGVSLLYAVTNCSPGRPGFAGDAVVGHGGGDGAQRRPDPAGSNLASRRPCCQTPPAAHHHLHARQLRHPQVGQPG